MLEYIAGKADSVTTAAVIVDVGGLGFEVLADAHTRAGIQPGQNVRLYTLMRIVDDRITLYGFSSRKQKDLFLKLVAVSGVGPKMALAVLSGLTTDQLVTAIITEDEKALQGIAGVGKKTAQRILLEMRGKVAPEEGSSGVYIEALQQAGGSGAADAAAEALEALERLGYTRQEAVQAVASVRPLADTAEELVRMALKQIGAKSR